MKKTENIKIFALGGVGEVGKNMYVIEINDDIYVVDAGLMFPEDEMLGIDMVIPDISYLVDNKARVKAILLTHGHEEQIGALPFILRKLDVPVYGTKLTIALVREKMKEYGCSKYKLLHIIDSNTVLTFDTTIITFFRTMHSIPDSVGICLQTSQGAVVHTGDFKFDQSYSGPHASEISKMAAIGEQGVLCLLSDSTNAERLGYTVSESVINQEISDAFYDAKEKGRIIVATYGSNITRIQQVINAAFEHERKLVVVGRTMMKVIELGVELGYLNVPEDTLISVQGINSQSDEKIAILTTGHQGEPMAALSRMARQAHKLVSIKEDDTVLIAATPIPGHETKFSKTIDLVCRIGATVVYGQKQIHTSGHGSQEELKFMINLMKPTYVLPIHGEYRMQKAHAKLAEASGIPQDHIFLLEKGDVIEIKDGLAQSGGRVQSGNTLIDGLGVGDVGNIVLRDRRLLSQDGILIVVVTIDKGNKKISAGPEIISRGFVYVRESEKLLEDATALVEQILQKCMQERTIEWSTLKLNMRESLNQFLFEKTRRRPMILPIIMEV
ncbi:ribonuclease J [Bacillus sp. CGMCC 1.16541]|uniref:ribonuclease J n=1 Tax=Bacillus sp. CGMCC 1.16541 TaxID=2185143 RepID=UPI000D739D51|nr:ribonuclease J [Bacillus sp. CGMCC 1.16541]